MATPHRDGQCCGRCNSYARAPLSTSFSGICQKTTCIPDSEGGSGHTSVYPVADAYGGPTSSAGAVMVDCAFWPWSFWLDDAHISAL